MYTHKLHAWARAGCLAAALLASPAVSVAAEVIRFGIFTPPKTTIMVKGIVPFLDEVTKQSKGAFQYKGFWGGSIMRNPEKQYEVLLSGLQDGTLSGWDATRSFRIGPLTVASIDMPFGTRSFLLVLNRQVYDRLPQQAKDALAKLGGEPLSRKFGKIFDDAEKAMTESALKNPDKVVISADKASRGGR